MDINTCKIALAALLHDVGKLTERAGHQIGVALEDKTGAFYQPENNLKHRHAFYTAAYLDQIIEKLPQIFKESVGAESLVQLAAKHHAPETPLQRIIAVADKLSLGLTPGKQPRKATALSLAETRKLRLIPVAEEIYDYRNPIEKQGNFRYRYNLTELSPDSLFPQPLDESYSATEEDSVAEYAKLMNAFTEGIDNLEHKGNPSVWLEHFESLFQIITLNIPSASVANVQPDISLYDHGKTTAAFAAALYLYHRKNNSLSIEAVQDCEAKKFILISGDFSGIQPFILAEGNHTNKAAAKLLRGRSFAVSLLSELAAQLFCANIGLPSTSIILNAAGKFTILAPNLQNIESVFSNTEQLINSWMLDRFYGETLFGFSFVTATADDFTPAKFSRLWQSLVKASEDKKYHKIDLDKSGGADDRYLHKFVNTLKNPLCPFCGKRPSHPNSNIDRLLPDETSACLTCRDHIYIGTKLAKSSTIAIFAGEVEGKEEKLCDAIFGKFNFIFDPSELDKSMGVNQLSAYWDISGGKMGSVSKTVTAKFISGYIPTCDEDYKGKVRTVPVTFEELAKRALSPDKKGVAALGVLKADIDWLGHIFACGLPEGEINLSRLGALSRQMNLFLSLYLPYLFANDERFKSIYIIFAGGDDLFVVGPWNRIIEVSGFIRQTFRSYLCKNESITISAGISVNKPGVPIPLLCAQAKTALDQAKDNNKNSVTIFNETVKWDKFEELIDIRGQLATWIADGTINSAMLFRLNALSDMVKQERNLTGKERKGKSVNIQDMECLKWGAHLRYSVARNVGKSKKGTEKQAKIEEVMATAKWLADFDGKLKIALWQVLYNQRGGNNGSQIVAGQENEAD